MLIQANYFNSFYQIKFFMRISWYKDGVSIRQKRSEIIKLKQNKKLKSKKKAVPKIRKERIPTTSNFALRNKARLKYHNWNYGYYYSLFYSGLETPFGGDDEEEIAIVNTSVHENEKLFKKSDAILNTEYEYLKPMIHYKKFNFYNYSKTYLKHVSMKDVTHAFFLCCLMDF
ncbi:unnamed protein product [Blepharisma stoltei]|uniref:Uncharacterized protein n=1 Tax=Blepharisma stoltei TaxID=1481888 RepID=A0AAU9IQR5_9CILI|nr:unnamed protein product [Blepharisma stoltei]